ncbi:MAG: GTPase domain-containing protein, partial [Gemmataceae bacterium]|nr:GTPase domain-containing protein [Gemmataceae bacterium]
HVLDKFVVWDCPDMTSWTAEHYVVRLLEVAGLADVVVYVASDERYNDAVPTQFLKLLLQAGKVVVACLVKMREAEIPALLNHFQQAVVAPLPVRPVACLAVPFLTHEQLKDPFHGTIPSDPNATKPANAWRIPLVNQVAVLGEPSVEVRRRTVHAAVAFLKSAESTLLGVARNDLDALQSWRRLVHEGRAEFDNQYCREFLGTERMRRFDEALVRLLQLLDLPGVGQHVSRVLNLIQTPYRWLRERLSKAMRRPPAPSLPERPVLENALATWLDLLRKESARRAGQHPLWQYVHDGWHAGLAERIKERFERELAVFHASMHDEVERTARAIYEHLERNPVALNTLRGAKLTLELGAAVSTFAAVATLGATVWLNLVFIPLATSVANHLVELLGEKYVNTQREQTRARQMALVSQKLSAPLAEWLIQWPATGNTPLERLQQVLQRLPHNIAELEAELRS